MLPVFFFSPISLTFLVVTDTMAVRHVWIKDHCLRKCKEYNNHRVPGITKFVYVFSALRRGILRVLKFSVANPKRVVHELNDHFCL